MNRVGAVLLLLLAIVAGAVPAAAKNHMRVELVAGDAGGRARRQGDARAGDAARRPAGTAIGRIRATPATEPRIAWQLPAGLTAGAAPTIPVPDRLIVAGLMNYVYERDYALLVDADGAGRTLAPGTRLPIARQARLSRLHRRGLRARERRRRGRPAGRRRRGRDAPTARFDRYRAARCRRPLGGDGAVRARRRTACGSRSRCPAAIARRRSLFLPADRTTRSTMPPRRRSRRNGDLLIVETERRRQRGGLAAHRGRAQARRRQRPVADRRARRGARRGHADRRGAGAAPSGRRRHPAGAARRAARRAAAQHHALRLPDPQPQGAEPRARPAATKPTRGARRWPIPAGVVLICLALGARPARPARRRSRRSAGRSSCRIRASSCCCCCW